MQEDRYQSKLERLGAEEEFILSHRIDDEVTERAMLHALEIAAEISMDMVAMKIRDMGLKVVSEWTELRLRLIMCSTLTPLMSSASAIRER